MVNQEKNNKTYSTVVVVESITVATDTLIRVIIGQVDDRLMWGVLREEHQLNAYYHHYNIILDIPQSGDLPELENKFIRVVLNWFSVQSEIFLGFLPNCFPSEFDLRMLKRQNIE